MPCLGYVILSWTEQNHRFTKKINSKSNEQCHHNSQVQPCPLSVLCEEVSHPRRQKGTIYCTSQCYKFSMEAQMSFLALTKNSWKVPLNKTGMKMQCRSSVQHVQSGETSFLRILCLKVTLKECQRIQSQQHSQISSDWLRMAQNMGDNVISARESKATCLSPVRAKCS